MPNKESNAEFDNGYGNVPPVSSFRFNVYTNIINVRSASYSRGVCKDEVLTRILNQIGVTVSQRTAYRNETCLANQRVLEIRSTGNVNISKLIIGKFTVAIADNIDKLSHDALGKETKFSHGLISCLVQEHLEYEYDNYKTSKDYISALIRRADSDCSNEKSQTETVNSVEHKNYYCRKYSKELHRPNVYDDCRIPSTKEDLDEYLTRLCLFSVGKDGSSIRSTTRFNLFFLPTIKIF
jgi:hypothetical protein